MTKNLQVIKISWQPLNKTERTTKHFNLKEISGHRHGISMQRIPLEPWNTGVTIPAAVLPSLATKMSA